MEASASVMVKGEVAITPEEGLPLQGDDQGPASGQIQMARTASTHPKTGDDTRRDLWTLLAATALVTVLGGIWLRKNMRIGGQYEIIKLLERLKYICLSGHSTEQEVMDSRC